LKENGFDTTLPNFDLTKIFSWAIANNQEAIIQWVIGRRASLQQTEHILNTMLHVAARYGRLAIVQVLLDQGADVHFKSSSGDIALHLAAEAGYKDVVRLLLEAGSDGRAKNNEGKTPHNLAGDNGHTGAFLVLHKWLDPGKPFRVERGKQHFLISINS
jgi:ankyrin repeat protein